METRANVIAIGMFVIAMIGAALGAVYWLATSGQATEEAELIVIFEGTVTGLTKSAAVYFNGIRIGNVSDIKFAEDDPTRVLAYTNVDATAPVKQDTTAELGFQGLTGVAHIELKGGSKDSRNLFGDNDATPTIVAKPSAFQDILETARQVMSKADVTLAEINLILKNNRVPLTNTMENVERFSNAIAENADNISRFLEDMSSVGRSFASLSSRLEDLAVKAGPIVDAVDPDRVSEILANASDLTGKLAEAAGKFDTVIADAEAAAGQVRDFAAGLNESLKKVDGVIDSVDREKVASAIDGLEAVTGAFRDKKEEIVAMIDDARGAAQNVNTVTARLAARTEDIDGIITDTRSVAKNADAISRKLDDASSDAAEIIAAVDPQSVKGSLDNVNRLTSRLAERTDNIDKIILDAEAALAEARTAVGNVREFTASINARKQSVDSIITSVESASGNLPDITADLKATLAEIKALAAAVEVDKINQAVSNISALTERIEKRGDDIDAIITSARKSTENAEDFTRALSEKSEEVQRIVDQALEVSRKLNAASARVNGLIDKVDGVVGDAETGGLISEARRAATSIANISEAFESRASRIANGVDRLTSTGVSKLEELIELGQRAVRQIETSVQNLEQNPQRVLFGGPKVRQFDGNRR